MKKYDLDGTPMPALGFGTWELKGDTCRTAVRTALNVGYRHLDTARGYGNEKDVGMAIVESGLAREDLFVTTKVWFEDLSPKGVEDQVSASLADLGLDYVDLVLVHWPNEAFPLAGTLAALEKERARGRTRLVGVSNFTPALVEQAREHAPVCCNQVEYHPLLDQSRLLEQCRALGMVLTAYSPLARGRALEEKAVVGVARRLGREPAQVVLRWLLQQDRVAAIPRSSSPDHVRSNFDVHDFALDDADMRILADLARGERTVDPDFAPWNA